MRLIGIGVAAALTSLICGASGVDLNSYCLGACQSRYASGFYSLERRKCACVDFVPVNLSQRFDIPKRGKSDPEPPHVYDGVDSMHFSPAEPDPPPTAPLDF